MGVIDRELLLAKMRLYFHMILADRGITNKEVTKVVRSMLDQVGDENIDVILELIDVIVKDPGDLNTICVTLEENRTPDVLRELFIDLLALSFVDKEVEKEVKLLDLIAVGLKISEKEVERDFNIFRGDFLKLRSDFSVLTIGGNDSEADVPFSLFQGKVVFMKIESRLFMLSINSAGVLINGVPLANNFHFIGFGEYDSIYCDTVHFGFDYAGIETLFKKKSLEKEKSGWIVRENSTMVLSETEHPESLLKFIHQKNRIYLEPLGEKWSIKLSGKPVDFSHPLIAFDSEPIEIIGFSNSIQISNVGTRNLSGSSDQVTEEIRLHEIDSSISEKIILKKINDQTRYLISISDWTNDILLNGEAVNSPFEIKHGDRIVAGNVFIRVDLKNPKKALFPFKIALSSLAMNSITARFKKAERNALENISFSLNAGDLGAVMGPAGSGKSTLLNSLLGGMKPASGFISVNGKKLDKGLLELQEHLGFVPQDDILIETLTAKENLYYTHKLMFPNDSTNREQTGELLLDILDKVGLREKADSIVGNIEQRLLSGGERKRLNIALELVSDPDILILDEPTSGLSSQDAEEIVGLLRAIADQGKMVLMVIHQPSSVIYKMIDTVLIINKGGKLAYSGSSLQALSLFNEVSKEPNSLNDYIECPACWEVNPNLLMKSLKTESTDFWQVVNKIEEEFTAKTGKQTTLKENSNQKSVLPAPRPMRTAAKFKQTWFQLKRQFKCKTRDRSNLLISFLAAPLIGFFSASVFQYSPSNQSYTLENNDQYPYFLFIMVLAAIFLGMTNSVLEIIKDRPILKRENLKNISLGGYFLSKFLVLSLFAFVQSILFLIPAHLVLQIPSALFPIHMGLMTLISVTGIILGLFFSSVVRSSVAAYNLVPLILIPQIILGGAFLPFENMGNNIFLGAKNEEKAVPLPAQLMPSRWAYEMLINANYEFHPLKKIEDTEQAERREKNKELMELRKKGKISVLRKADLINAISKKYEKQRQQFEGTQNRSITEFNHRPRGEFLSRQHSTAEVFWENSRLKKTLEKTWLRNLLVLLLFTVLTYLLAMVSMTKQMNRKT